MKETIVLPEDYYLGNFQALVDFVATRFADLLNESGQTLLNTFNRLDRDAQKLYVRLTGKKRQRRPSLTQVNAHLNDIEQII